MQATSIDSGRAVGQRESESVSRRSKHCAPSALPVDEDSRVIRKSRTAFFSRNFTVRAARPSVFRQRSDREFACELSFAMQAFSTMPNHQHGDVNIHYEEFGKGYPVLLLAPGGMRSNIEFWKATPYDPTIELANDFRLIAMDQRNAGESTAPISGSDGWHVYIEDQLALLDHLKIEGCHAIGNCIGGAFALALASAVPKRITAAVLQQPIGHSAQNRETFYSLFGAWAEDQKKLHPEVVASAWDEFRERMYGGDFVFAASRDAVRKLQTPLLVLQGNDIYHPSATSHEIAELAPHAELVERWKDPEIVSQTVARVREFLLKNTPK